MGNKLKVVEFIIANKSKILPQLYEWAETFNPENILYNINTIDEKEEDEMFNSYEYVLNLVEKFERNDCNENDYANLYFHIEQINYNEIKIVI